MENRVTSNRLTFDLTVSEQRENELSAHLVAYNQSHAPPEIQKQDSPFASAPLHLYAQDAQGQVVGGVVGTSHYVYAWFHISLVYVAEDWRGQGLGRELMSRAEAEAVDRGCRYARLATGDYQAPGFYEKCGYVLYGTLEDCPPGTTVYYYRKDLVPAALGET